MFLMATLILPPIGIAWRALIVMLSSACSIWLSSKSHNHVSFGIVNTGDILEPLRAKDIDFLTHAAIDWVLRIGAPPLEKVSNCCVKYFALSKTSIALERVSATLLLPSVSACIRAKS